MRNIIAIIASVLYCCVAYCQDIPYFPQVREGVEWGYSCASVVPAGNVEFFRLQFKGKTTINGKEYSNLYKYDTYFLFPSAQKPIAWMREADKKVFCVFNAEYKDLAGEYGCELYNADDEEVLIMDYGVNPGDTFAVGKADFDITATCISVEPIMIGDTQREMFTLSIRSKLYADEITTVKFVEGIGPVSYKFPGDGSFLFSFCMPMTGLGFPQKYDGWLYEREVMPVDESGGDPDLYIYTMGEITSTSPIYDYCGVHDPTIWYWMENYGASNIEVTSRGHPELKIESENGTMTVSSTKSPIVRLLLFQPDGTMLKSIRTKQETVQLPLLDYAGKMLILEIDLANGEKAVKKIVYKQNR